MSNSSVTIIGGGLAGCEAAFAISKAGVKTRLFEMRPGVNTPAHQTGLLAELVCSNSLKSDELTNASGLLKAEMDALGSVILKAARDCRVPAGAALAVDRERFAASVTQTVAALPGVEIVREEVSQIPEGIVIIATGPLTSEAMASEIKKFGGGDDLYFYDAIAPIVTLESIDFSIAFRASRWGKGEGSDYINCPMSKDEYESFIDNLLAAEKVTPREFEDPKYFEGCLPIEVMAERGRETLAYGPMRPVGLFDPRTGRRPHAVVQLRQDDREGKTFNLVGFQTRLKHGEQERIFRQIPGLQNAVFTRLGSIHRNTFINSPKLLAPDLSLRANPNIFFAGQLSGVEGYLESAASGIIAGINAARRASGRETIVPPPATMIGALLHYITDPARENFSPMNSNFGILPDPDPPVKKKDRKTAMVERALTGIRNFALSLG